MPFNTLSTETLELMFRRWSAISAEEPNNPYAQFMRFSLNRMLRNREV